MPDNPSTRSVKIDPDERGGWTSDRPRRDGSPGRPPNVAVRCRVLSPAEDMRYAPGSLFVVVSPAPEAGARFAERVVEDKGAVMGLGKVRGLLAGRVEEDALEERAGELLRAAVAKRLDAGETVVLVADTLDAEERAEHVQVAVRSRRPCHLALVEAGTADLDDERRGELNKLRKRLDSGALGEEGFLTALRLSGSSLEELRRVRFAPPPRDD